MITHVTARLAADTRTDNALLAAAKAAWHAHTNRHATWAQWGPNQIAVVEHGDGFVLGYVGDESAPIALQQPLEVQHV